MQSGVLNKLRIKFIAINMAMATLVLVCTFGTVCTLDYFSSVNSINTYLTNVLNHIAQADNLSGQVEGVQPLEVPDEERADIAIINEEEALFRESGLGNTASSSNKTSNVNPPAASGVFTPKEDANNSAATNAANGVSSNSTTPSPGTVTENAAANTAEKEASLPVIGRTITEGRILSAAFRVYKTGIYTALPGYSTASLPESTLLRANAQIINSPNFHGYLSEFDLIYEKAPTNGGWFVVYADAATTHAWKSLAMLLTIVGLIALVIFFLINIAFSNWALRPVARSIKQQQQFTADASHELKTPLTVILANLSILRSHPNSTVDEQMQWIASSETEAQRMQGLVNDMLSLARPKSHAESSKTFAAFEPLDLSDLVEGEVLQFESVAFERGIMLESSIAEGIFVKGDAEKLGRMVSTLIDNACKYVEENGTVQVTLEVDGSNALVDPKAVLRVYNTGEPIPADDIAYLFDRFFRADKARTGGKGGYGLGLAIGRDIAREHHGDITVSSSDEGTTFTVTLPTV